MKTLTSLSKSVPYVLILASVIYFGLTGKPTEMGISVAAAGLMLIFLNLDKFQSFKALGLLQGELRKATQEAYATIDMLRKLAEPLAVLGMFTLARGNRLSSMTPFEKEELKDRFEVFVKEINLHSPKYEEERKLFFKLTLRDHLNCLQYIFRKQANLTVQQSNDLQDFLLRPPSQEPPTVDEIRKYLASCSNEISKEVEDAIQDYEYYLKNNRLRRPAAAHY